MSIKGRRLSILTFIFIMIFMISGCSQKLDDSQIKEKYKSYDEEFLKEYADIKDKIIEITEKKSDKKDIIEEINKLWKENREDKVSYAFGEKIILEKYRNKTVNPGKLVDKDAGIELEEDDVYYVPMFNSGYIVDLIERHSEKEGNLTDWTGNVKYLEENYDELVKFDEMNEDDIVQMNLYISTYSQLIK